MSIEAVLGMLGKIVSLLKDLNIFIWPRLELKLLEFPKVIRGRTSDDWKG